MELLPGAGASPAHPDGGVYDVHPGPGVMTIGPLLEVTPGAPVSSATRQTSPPPVVRDLGAKQSLYLSIFYLCKGDSKQ